MTFQPSVFISYSHQDEMEKEALMTHLGVLQSDGRIDLWSDERIGPGEDWEKELDLAINQACVAILLITANYLSSNFILAKQLPRLFRRRSQEGLIVFPVIARACAWKKLAWLHKMEVRPKPDETVWGNNGNRVHENLAAIAEEIAEVVRKCNPPHPNLKLLAQQVDTYLAAQRWDDAVALLDDKNLRSLYMENENRKILADWLSIIPRSKLKEYPRLLLSKGQILTDNHNQPNRPMIYFCVAEAEFRRQKDEVGVAKARIWRSVSLRMIGQAGEAVRLARDGLDRLQKLTPDNKQLLAWGMRNLGLAHGTAGGIFEALSYTFFALHQYDELKDEYLVAQCHHDIGVSVEKQGDIERAVFHYRKAKEFWKNLNKENELASTLCGLGNALNRAGYYTEALAELRESRKIAYRVNDLRRIAFSYAGMGDAHFNYGRYAKATEAYKRSTQYAQKAKVESLIISNQINLSECSYYLAQQYTLVKAFREAQRAKESAMNKGLDMEKARAEMVQAKICIRLGRYASSFELLQKAVEYFDQNGILNRLIEAQLWWGEGLLRDKQEVQALSQLQKVIELVPDVSGVSPELKKIFKEVQDLLRYFTNWADTPEEMRNKLNILIS